MSDEIVGGWNPEAEDHALLEATSENNWLAQVDGLYGAPDEIDPHAWHVVHNQGQQGACAGHSLTSNGEYTFRIATSKVEQFSRQFAYTQTQKHDGITGNRGSTIAGGEWLAKNVGFPLETLWPYTGQYVLKPPSGDLQACYDDAKKRRIKTTSSLRSYDECFKWLSSGAGGIHIGITWNASMHSNGVIESYSVNAGGGGHAVALLGYSKRKDSKGRNYLWLVNSWGLNWGQKGMAEVAPIAIESMLKTRYAVFRGMSDMAVEDMKPRPVDFSVEIKM